MRVRDAFQSPSLEAGTCVLSVELRDIHSGMSLVFQQCFMSGDLLRPSPAPAAPGGRVAREERSAVQVWRHSRDSSFTVC